MDIYGDEHTVALLDPDLAEALQDASPDSLRRIARDAAHHAVSVAGLRPLPWVADALAALDAGRLLPPPWDE